MNAKKLATIVAASFSIATAGAQGHNDVLRFNKSTYLGTARSQAWVLHLVRSEQI